MPVMDFARRALRAPGVAPLLDRPAVRRVVRAGQIAVLTEEPLRFFATELRRPARVGGYHLKGSSDRVHLRHGTPDLDIVYELERLGLYDPPPAVAAALGTPRTVLDLGAHVGLFGVWARRRWPGCTVTSFEPDQGNAAILRRTVGDAAAWTVHEEAAAAADGVVRFRSGKGPGSHIDPDDPAAEDVPARDVLGLLAGADLAKIDIEGGEWDLFADPRFAAAPPRAIVLEYHPRGAPAGPLEEVAHGVLRDAGYATAEIPGAPGGVGMLWAWRPA